MTEIATTVRQVRARLDRLPPAWQILVAGFVAHLGLSVALLGFAYARGAGLAVITNGILVALVVVTGIAAIPALALLWDGRYRRTAAATAVLAGLIPLLVTDADPITWVFPLALFLAAIRAWAGAGLDVTTLFDLDPDRFERVSPDAMETGSTPETDDGTEPSAPSDPDDTDEQSGERDS